MTSLESEPTAATRASNPYVTWLTLIAVSLIVIGLVAVGAGYAFGGAVVSFGVLSGLLGLHASATTWRRD